MKTSTNEKTKQLDIFTQKKLKELKSTFIKKIIGYTFTIPLAQIALILNAVFTAPILAGGAGAFFPFIIGLFGVWIFVGLITAAIYNKIEGITDSSYTYKTGRTIYESTYNERTKSVTTTTRDEYATSGGGEYGTTLVQLLFVGIIFYIRKIVELTKNYNKTKIEVLAEQQENTKLQAETKQIEK